MSQKITVQSSISAAVKKVWSYYTDPAHIVNWNFAADDWHCPSAENDLKVGGKYKSRMEAKDGSFGFDFVTIYSEVEPEKKLAYTMEDGRVASIKFDGDQSNTHVIVEFDAETINAPELQQQGWQAILNNFKKYTESN